MNTIKNSSCNQNSISYYNLFNIRKPKVAFVPCLTPGCANKPDNIEICQALAYQKYINQSKPDQKLEIYCSKCQQISKYDYESLLEKTPEEMRPVPLPKSYIWAINLYGIGYDNEGHTHSFYGERLLVNIEESKSDGDWIGKLVSESQLAPSLYYGCKIGGWFHNRYHICGYILDPDRKPIPTEEQLPRNVDIGLFYLYCGNNTEIFQSATIFCSNPSCGHIFGQLYSQFKEKVRQQADNRDYIVMMKCNICGVVTIADEHSYDNLFKV